MSILHGTMRPDATRAAGQISVRPFQVSDEAAVLELLQAGFGSWPTDVQGATPAKFFAWKHAAGPLGRSLLLVAEADDQIVGFAAYMPWRFRADDRVISAMRGVDFVVHAGYRRRGVSMALRAAAEFSSDVAFVWSNPNDVSRRSGLKWGQREIGGLAHFLRPSKALRRTLAEACSSASRRAEDRRVEAQSAADVLHEEARVQPVLDSLRPPRDRLATAIDLDYLRWRYGGLQDYHAIVHAGGRGAMLIFRTRPHGRVLVAVVCELLHAPHDHRAARRLLAALADVTRAPLISCSFASRREAALCGFVIPSRYRAVVMAYPLQENLVPDPTRPRSWAPSLGDLELL